MDYLRVTKIFPTESNHKDLLLECCSLDKIERRNKSLRWHRLFLRVTFFLPGFFFTAEFVVGFRALVMV